VKKYQHLNLEERETLRVGLEKGESLRKIAKKLGRSHTTVAREIQRNQLKQGKDQGQYIACKAQIKADKRGRLQRTKSPLKEPFIFLYVRTHLREGNWSPEQIAGRLTLEYPEYSINHETIYRYVYSKSVRNRYKLWRYLTLKRKRRMSKGGRSVKRPSRLGAPIIDLRPEEVNTRMIPGHWETDNMNGVKTDHTSVSVTVDRKLRYTSLVKVTLDSQSKSDAVVDGLLFLPEFLRQTLTFDNGPENALYQATAEKLKVSPFACHPYHSWEKGTVENTVGRVRRFIPKKTSVDQVTPEYLLLIQNKLNNTPRKCLGFKTPKEAMQEALSP